MIKKIGIENFRVFKDYTEFKLAPITVLTGPNNSGKSSLIKLLSLLKYSFTKEDRINKLNFVNILLLLMRLRLLRLRLHRGYQ